jgi:hypothetical protein
MVILPASLAQTKPDTPTFTIEYPLILDFNSDGLNLNITNKPFTPYTDHGYEVNLYYEAQIRKQGWVDSSWAAVINAPTPYVKQSDSQYTVIPLPISHNLDVRVRAVVGTVIDIPYNPDTPYSARYEFKGVEGDWSNIQIVTINLPTSPPTSSLPSNTSPANTNPSTPNPSLLEPDFDNNAVWSIAGVALLVVVILVVGIVLVVVGVVVWLLLKKRKV